MIDISKESWIIDKKAWVASIRCEAVYLGSTVTGLLTTGNYLLVKKTDGSISLHGANLNQPRNYLRSTSVEVEDNIITFIGRKEKLRIKVTELWWFKLISDLSETKVELWGTERQLVDKLVENLYGIVPETKGAKIIREYIIPNCGPIDVAVFSETDTWLFEVKRKKITKRAISQIMSYRHHYKENKKVHSYLVGPEISPGALEWAREDNIKFIELYWDQMPQNFKELI